MKRIWRNALSCLMVSCLTALLAAGCATVDHTAVSHRHSVGSEAKIVILPVGVPEDAADDANEGRTIAHLYATELLKVYEILEYDRFARLLEERGLTLEDVLREGTGPVLSEELGIDGILLSEVYEWKQGTPGIWILAKKGRLGFQARLVEVERGAVIWSVNRVTDTNPDESLRVAASRVFAELIEDMPRNLTPY